MSHRTDEPASRLIGRNFVLLGGGQILSTALGLLLTAALTRALGPTEFGQYYLILTILFFVGVVMDWGQGSVVIREIARGRPDRDSYIASAAVLRAITLVVAIGLAGIIAHGSGYPPFVVWLVMIGVTLCIPGSFVSLAAYVFRGLDRTDVDVTANLLVKLIATVATVAALYLGGGVIAAVVVPVVGAIAGLAYILRVAWLHRLRPATPNWVNVRELFLAGLPIVVMAFTMSLQSIMDVTLLAKLTNDAVVGLFGAARTLSGVLFAPAVILAAASFPELSRTAEAPVAFAAIVETSARPLMAVGALGACLLYTFAEPAVRIAFGRADFAPAAMILQVSAAFFPIFFINSLLGNAAIALQKTRQIATAKIGCVAICGIASWFLVPFFQTEFGNGAIGVMLAYGATEFLMFGAFIALMPPGGLVKIVVGHLARACLAAGATALVASTFASLLPIWIAGPLVLGVFAFVALAIGLVRSSDVVDAMIAVRSAAQRLRGAT